MAETVRRCGASEQVPAESGDAGVPDLLSCCVIEANPLNLSECSGHLYNEKVTLGQSFFATDGV